MKQKIFKLKYNIDYTAPRMNPPYNLVLLADGVAAGPPGNTSPPSDRMLLSHRREIKDKKNGTTIGDASYLIHIHKIELNGEETSGAIYSITSIKLFPATVLPPGLFKYITISFLELGS